jgi:predicted DNA-binding transcriptional regulator AlpA
MTILPTLVRFCDLKARGIVRNWVTLRHLVDERGFPPGRKLGPNTRVWTEDEIAAWLASRPIDLKPWPTCRAAE